MENYTKKYTKKNCMNNYTKNFMKINFHFINEVKIICNVYKFDFL